MQLFPREKYLAKIRGFYDADDLIKVITGVRRCGKSSLMKMIAAELQQQGVPASHIVYIDLDSRDYLAIRSAAALDQFIATHLQPGGLTYLFIDEIQNISGFEEVINSFRNEGGCSIFITGSNSYLLSGELTTKLTGRYVEFEIYPLSFEEYVEMKRFYHKNISPDSMEELSHYILEGGFPRAIGFDRLSDKRTYVNSVVQEIFEKDIKRRVTIRDQESFERVRTFIINNFGATTSIRKLHEALLRNGMEISRKTVDKYIRILVDAKILYECPRFDMKSKRALAGEKKYYLSDLGFYFTLNTDNRINYGPVLENLVYLYARSLSYQISVGRIGKLECDFILRNQELEYAYVQVALTILNSPQTENREYRSLEMIRDNYPKYMVTCDRLLQKRNGVQHVNLMDFMLQHRQF